VVTPEWTMDADGMVHVPRDKLGIGIGVDTARIEDLTVKREALESRTMAAR
jgi:hypothetical protein